MREIRKRPRVDEAADHRADRQGDEGRPGEVPRRRRQRLHRQAARRREAALARARLDAEVATRRRGRPATSTSSCGCCSRRSTSSTTTTSAATRAASLQAAAAHARWRASAARRSRSCRTGCCTTRASFPRCCDFLTVPGQRDVPRPGLLPRAARAGGAAAAHLSVAQGLGGRLQHRRGGVLAGDPAARGRAARAHADLRDRHQPAGAAEGARPASTTLDRIARLHREPPARPAARASLSDYYTAAYGARGASTSR